jgi:hypothetical protein
MKKDNLDSTQLEAQILESDWTEYVALRKKRISKFSTELSSREIQLFDRGITMENWQWLFVNYHDIRVYMS